MRNRHVVFWADNSTALAAAVHGDSAYPDLPALSNTLHLLLAGLRTRTFFMHVPGEANIADISNCVPFVPGVQPVLQPAGLKPADKTAIDSIADVHRQCQSPQGTSSTRLKYSFSLDTDGETKQSKICG